LRSVTKVEQGSVAHRAGVQAGQAIVAVGAVAVKDASHARVVELIRGARDSGVEVTLHLQVCVVSCV
jgi:C-terminal processing protease CtpA/Prc